MKLDISKTLKLPKKLKISAHNLGVGIASVIPDLKAERSFFKFSTLLVN